MSNSEEKNLFSRRRFLQWSQAAMTAMGVAPFTGGAVKAFAAGTSSTKPAGTHQDYYDKLGVTKIINAAGTLTVLTGSTMPPQVQQAVAEAAKHPVHLIELQTKAGEYIAKRTQNEAAMISCGAASALSLITAACVQAANGCKPSDIPQNVILNNLKNEVIIQKTHRSNYDHSMYLCGIKFVEIETLDEYKAAFGPNTVMTHYLNSYPGKIGHQDWLDIAHQHNIPCNVDAAAEIPPISNLWNFTKMGFDTVCFSGGKGMRGPQNAGLLLGKKRLIDFATQNNDPFEGVGRGMKIAKEQIVGMVAAVDWVLEQTDAGLAAEANQRIDVITRHIKNVPTMKTNTYMPPLADHTPTLEMKFDPTVLGITAKEVQARLRALKPAIELNGASTGRPTANGADAMDSISVETWMLQPGEDEIVGRELRKALMSGKAKA